MAQELFRCATSVDLADLSRQLWQQGFPHRIETIGSWQFVSVGDEVDLFAARALVEAWMAGEELQVQVVKSSERESMAALIGRFSQVPITTVLCVFSFVGFASTQWLPMDTLLSWLTFQNFQIRGAYITVAPTFEAILQGEWWRVLTPAFIHFGWLHIAFNTLWTIEFGRCIERRQGSVTLLAVFVWLALVSNIAQAIMADNLFGGMSGAIYGFLGYCWLGNRLRPGSLPCVSPALFGFMLGWLVLCMSGVVTMLGFGQIANTAHVAGLLAGFLAALVWPRRFGVAK
ncbi:MAG TPA: rhomboid family intramembrane serine protease [Pseudomonadales bacterium]|nr:rhomboid family intramembrane serine protease [Pseudomonadales bacterium]